MLSSCSSIGIMSDVRMRVAARDWWPSRSTVSTIFTGLAGSDFVIAVWPHAPGEGVFNEQYR